MERDLRDLPSVLYRADGSTTVGLGHIAHAIRLDRVLRDSGVASVRLVGRLDDSTAAFAEDAGLIPHWPLERTADEPDQILAALDETRASFIAFNLPRELLETAEPSLAAVAASGVPQVHFDNPMQSSRYGDLVVNALPHVDWGVDLSANPRVLEGLDYLLPDPSLAPVGSRERGADVERVLVSMGGGDESNLTSIVMRTLDAVGFVGIVDVVVGAASRHLDVVRSLAADVRCEARVHQQLLSLAPLVAEADLAFSALGLTTYEFAAAGLPAAILAGTELNARVADIYAKSGTACSLGLYQDRSPDELVLRVGELLADGAGRRSMSRRGPRLVDGLGAQRLLILLKGLLHG
jgi:spore coat polysaccharide biosynthesis protein SpsF